MVCFVFFLNQNSSSCGHFVQSRRIVLGILVVDFVGNTNVKQF